MRFSLLESLRRIIWRDLHKVGKPVGNVYGAAVQVPSELTSVGTQQTWARFVVSGQLNLVPDQVMQRWHNRGGSTTLEDAVSGVLTVDGVTGSTQLLTTVVTVTQQTRLAVTVQCSSGGEAALWLNGTQQRVVRGASPTIITLSIPAGKHRLAVVVFGSGIMVTTPATVTLSGMQEVLPAVVWRSVTTEHADSAAGTAKVTLRWEHAPSAGAYQVFRREPVELSGAVISSELNLDTGTGYVRLDTDVTSAVFVGDTISALGLDLGLVTSVFQNAAETETSLSFALNPEITRSANLVDVPILVGNYKQLATVENTGDGAYVEYVDIAVAAGQLYEYSVRATGVVDTAVLGPLNDARWIVAGDVLPPGAITMDAGYPQVSNRQVTVRFQTPTDADYQGVQVVSRQIRDNSGTPYTIASIAGAVITLNQSTLSVNELNSGLWRVQIDTTDASYKILSNTTNTITVDTPITVSYVTNDPVLLFLDTDIKTDFGTPDTHDEFSFIAPDYGEYYFASFDRGGNRQSYGDATTWTYDPTDDTFTTGPIIAFRQLPVSEQAYFAGYTDTVTYAVLEVYAYEINGTTAAGTVVYYRSPGASATSLPLGSVQSGAFPRTVSTATAVDVPAGTRSRYIAVARSTGRVELWAENSQGYESDRVTVVIDVDDRPSITSLETIISSTTNVASVTAIVDDDTEAIGWRIDSGSLTYINTTTVKSPNLPNIALAPGQQKFLEVIPYRYWNGGSPTDSGEMLSRSLVRTPKSFVNIDSKDSAGDRSATNVTSTFTMAPAPAAQVIAGGLTTRTANINSTRDVLTDTGSPAWSTDQWTNGNHKATFAKVTFADGMVEVRRVLSNTSGALTLVDKVSRTENGVSYQLLDGAVLIRTSTTQGYLPTPGTDVRSRTTAFTYDFYAVKSGCIPETPRSIVVDADSLPSLTGVTYDFDDTADSLSVLFNAADDDATYWEVYERRVSGAGTNHWPTLTGAPAQTIADLDPSFLRWSGPVEINRFTRSVVGNATGEWYLVVVVKNSFGQPGPLYTDTIDLGTYTPAPLLLTTTLGANTTTDDLTVAFTGNPSATSGMNVTIVAKRMDNPAITSTINTTVGASQPHLFDVPALTGEELVTSGGTLRTWEIAVTLNSYNTITKQIQVRSQPATATVAFSAYAQSVTNLGACDNNYCYSLASYPYERRITWTVTVDSVNVTYAQGYTVDITYAADSGGSSYTSLVSGINAADGQYYHQLPCRYVPVSGGDATYFKYQLRAYNSSGTLVAGPVTITQESANLAWCSEGGNAF
jgi:hypothetical protein